MRVIVIHNLPPGGASRRLTNQIRHFSEPVIEVCLQSATPITPDAIVVSFEQVSPRLPRTVRPPARYLDMAGLERAWKRLAQRVQVLQPDVLYINPCRYLQAPPIPVWDLPPAVYFCDEARRVDAEPAAAARRNRVTRPIYAPLYARERNLDRRTVDRVHTIATNSHYTASEIERVYGRVATVITMGVAESLRPETLPSGTSNSVLSVGSLMPSKGHELVVMAAAAASSRPTVQIVAPRPDAAEQDRLSRIARNCGVTISFEIGISDAELSQLYTSAICTVYLAQREPLGLVSLEAQAHGCPVVVAAEGGLPETIVDGVTGWSCARDPRAAAALIDRLSDEPLRLRMSEAARAHASAWTWRASAAEVERLLAAAAGDGRTDGS